MASDAIQNRSYYKSKIPSFELSRLQPFVNGDADIFDVLAEQKHRHADDPELHDAMDATISLLKDAQHTIDRQSNRIRALEDKNMIDELTGLYNRRGFQHGLERELSRLARVPERQGIFIAIQLENMTSIHTRYGTLAGTTALKLLGAALQQETRVMDLAARIDRDAFALLFVEADEQAAMTRIQDLNVRLNKLSFLWRGQDIRLTVSLSIKACRAGHRSTDFFSLNDDGAPMRR